ncbi:MAG TPA: extracellular solute-binding protein [Firmicutes bacterium]|nr:extracellular solute-binding protein [Bacillota bacterium]
MFKRFLFLSFFVIILFCYGCVGSIDDRGDIVTITIWENYNNEEHDVFVRIVRDFEDRYNSNNPDIPVFFIVERVPFDGLLPKLKTSAMTKTTPDICRVDIAHVVPLAFGKALFDLNQFGAESLHAKLVPAAINSNIIPIKQPDGTVKAGTYGLPDQTNTTVLFYNKDIFRKRKESLLLSGLDPNRAPRTWEEFIEYSLAINHPEEGVYAFAMNNSLWWTFPFFNTFGAEFISFQDGQFITRINEPAAIAALQFKVDLYRRYGVEAGAWQSGALGKEQGFINGKYAMIITGPWMVKTFKNSGIDFGTALIPSGPAGTSSNVGGTNMVIFKTCKHPEIAYEFLSYLVSEEVQVFWSNELGQIPVVLSAFDKIDTSVFPELGVFMEQMKTAQARPLIPNYDILETDIVNPEMYTALTGEKSVEDALNAAARMIESEILSIMNE